MFFVHILRQVCVRRERNVNFLMIWPLMGKLQKLISIVILGIEKENKQGGLRLLALIS